ncbi:MAG: TonB-dependent receptor, partial [Gammaproteobacteria bacterium]|nr:TonB-dependent receptor [Gammaproteobacteria bacterium]
MMCTEPGSRPLKGLTFSTALLSACLVSPQAFAAGELEEIVVTATRTEKLLQVNPWSVSVLNEIQLQKQSADQLADILRDLPGLVVSDAGQAGQKRIRIRGEEARRMALLIDGQEFIDHREVGVPLLVDSVNIARVELVRGPASVLYGPKAMGGVINIITRKDFDSPLNGHLGINYDGATDGTLYSASFGGRVKDTEWQTAFSDNSQGERDSPDGRIENTAYQSRGYSARIKQFAGNHSFGLAFEQFEASSDVYVEPEVRFTPPFLDFSIDIPVRDRNKVSLNHLYLGESGPLQSVAIDAYQQVSDREFNTRPLMQLGPGLVMDTRIDTTSQLVSNGFNLQSEWLFAEDHTVVLGYQFTGDEVQQNRQRDALINGFITSSESVDDTAKLDTSAVYVQDDWSLTPVLSLVTGARFYQVDGRQKTSTRTSHLASFKDSHAIGSVALVYNWRPDTTLRLNVSQGYIYPSLLNLAIGAFAGSRFINPVADLRPETSTTSELGIRYSGETTVLDAVLFNSQASDYIDHVFCNPEDACLTDRDKIYRNVGESDSYGLEVSLSKRLADYQLYADATWIRRKKNYQGVNTWDSGIPELSGRLGLRRTWHAPLEVNLFARFATAADDAELTRRGVEVSRYAGYATVNANLHYSFA